MADKKAWISAYLRLTIKDKKHAPWVTIFREDGTVGKIEEVSFRAMCLSVIQRVLSFYSMLYLWDISKQIESVQSMLDVVQEWLDKIRKDVKEIEEDET